MSICTNFATSQGTLVSKPWCRTKMQHRRSGQDSTMLLEASRNLGILQYDLRFTVNFGPTEKLTQS